MRTLLTAAMIAAGTLLVASNASALGATDLVRPNKLEDGSVVQQASSTHHRQRAHGSRARHVLGGGYRVRSWGGNHRGHRARHSGNRH